MKTFFLWWCKFLNLPLEKFDFTEQSLEVTVMLYQVEQRAKCLEHPEVMNLNLCGSNSSYIF
jgi:hypothetical protein